MSNLFSNLSTNDNCQIFYGDCMEKLKDFQNEGLLVQHIITDPPYNIATKNNFQTMKSGNRAGIDFGDWDWNFDPTQWLKYAYPLLDKNGSMIIFCSYKYISDICNKIENLGGIIKDILIWQKQNPMPRNIHRRYVQDMEFAIWAVKNKNSKWIFNKSEQKPYERAFYQTPTLLGKERTEHPTQKPIKLMLDIIKLHTNENDLILDPFMGTGSTGVASIQLNRKFIGIEKEEQWFEIAKNRLEY